MDMDTEIRVLKYGPGFKEIYPGRNGTRSGPSGDGRPKYSIDPDKQEPGPLFSEL